jgi:translation initiation factor 1 (eIF-1/SUI1)
MNPFEDFNDNNDTDQIVDQNTEPTILYIWVQKMGRKSNTYVSGWSISDNEIKSHLKTIKKSIGCNGSIKNMIVDGNDTIEQRVMHLQGEHAVYLKEFICNTGIEPSLIHIKG